MKLKELLDLNLDNVVSITIGSENGQRWLCYHDGNKEYGEDIEKYFDREVKEIWVRQARTNKINACGNPILPLKRGLAVIVEGDEDGII